MKIVEPKLYLVAAMTERPGLNQYLQDIGAINSEFGEDWSTDAPSFADKLVEIAGRLCYRAFFPWNPNREECSNENVGKIRESNTSYINNVLSQGHGSIFEHPTISIMFYNVSRIVTHEIVRHRVGIAFSQESMRYVRLTNMKIWIPNSIRNNDLLVKLFIETVGVLEVVQTKLVEMTGINKIKDFAIKKHLTSMFRRLSPGGLATSILITANARTWRHVLAMRGSPAAEEEMTIIMPQLLEILKGECPNIFEDVRIEDGFIKMDYVKV